MLGHDANLVPLPNQWLINPEKLHPRKIHEA